MKKPIIPLDPPVSREAHQSIIVLRLAVDGPSKLFSEAEPLTDALYLGRYGAFVDKSSAELPKILEAEDITSSAISFKALKVKIERGRFFLAITSSGALFAVIVVDFKGGMSTCIDALQELYYQKLVVRNRALSSYIRNRLQSHGIECDVSNDIFSHFLHQFIHLSEEAKFIDAEESFNVVQKLIYRADLPARKEFSAIVYPMELNRRPGSVCALGEYVTVLSNQQQYVENSLIISAMQVIAALSELAHIRKSADIMIDNLSKETKERTSWRDREKRVAKFSSELARLNLRMAATVEAPLHLGLLIPSMRLERYHLALLEASQVSARKDNVSALLTRLNSIVASKKAVVTSLARMSDQISARAAAITVGLISVISIPPSIVLAFFGTNTVDIDREASLMEFAQYGFVYFSVFLAFVLALGIGGLCWSYFSRRFKKFAADLTD